jgi:hypothetical protein
MLHYFVPDTTTEPIEAHHLPSATFALVGVHVDDTRPGRMTLGESSSSFRCSADGKGSTILLADVWLTKQTLDPAVANTLAQIYTLVPECVMACLPVIAGQCLCVQALLCDRSGRWQPIPRLSPDSGHLGIILGLLAFSTRALDESTPAPEGFPRSFSVRHRRHDSQTGWCGEQVAAISRAYQCCVTGVLQRHPAQPRLAPTDTHRQLDRGHYWPLARLA